MTVKLLALLFGLLSFGLVFLVPFMGALAPVSSHLGFVIFRRSWSLAEMFMTSVNSLNIYAGAWLCILQRDQLLIVYWQGINGSFFSLQISISISGFFSGSLFAVFLLGIYVPFANSWASYHFLCSDLDSILKLFPNFHLPSVFVSSSIRTSLFLGRLRWSDFWSWFRRLANSWCSDCCWSRTSSVRYSASLYRRLRC